MNKKILRKLCVFFLVTIFVGPIYIYGQAPHYIWDEKIPTNCTTDDLARGITLDGKGNSYVVGTFVGNATFQSLGTLNSGGLEDIFIAKAEPLFGNYQWVAQGIGVDKDDARSVAVYPDGAGGVNTYVTGFFTGSVQFTSFNNPGTVTIISASGNSAAIDMFLVKYNDQGIVQWAIDCGNSTYGTWPGNQTMGHDIAVNYNRGVISIWVAGSFMGQNQVFGTTALLSASGNFNQNGFLACYTDGISAPAGGATWAVGMESVNTCQAEGVDADDNGNTYLTGYWLLHTQLNLTSTTGGPFPLNPWGSDDGFVAKYDGVGTISALSPPVHFGNNMSVPNQINHGTAGEGIAVGKDGSVYVTGAFIGPPTNPAIFLGGPTLTSGYAAPPATSYSDGFLMKLNNAITTVLWLDRIGGGTAEDDGERVVVDNCGLRCYVVGDFMGAANFGNSGTINSTGNVDAFLADFDATNGNNLAVTHSGGIGGSAGAWDVAVNSVEDIQYCGFFSNANLTSPDPGWTNLGIGGASDGFVARWDHSNWPALETTGMAINQGISVIDCVDYAVGDMVGLNVTFAPFTQTSSQTNNLSAYTNDIYLSSCDKYAKYSMFVKLTNGTSAETSTDLVSSSSFHYVAGNAATGSNQNGIAFFNDPGGLDNYTNSNSTSNAIVIKSDLLGSITTPGTWAASVRPAAASSSTGQGVAYDASGNVYFCGYFNGTVTAYNSGGTPYSPALVSTGSTDIFVIKYSSIGQVLWAKKFGGTGADAALGISIDPYSTNYYISGYHSGTITFVAGFPHTAVGFTDGFVMKGNLSSGVAINNAFWGVSGTFDKGLDIYSNGSSEVYITGVKTVNKLFVASYDLTAASPPSTQNWAFTSTGSGQVFGNDILLGQNAYLYISGLIGSSPVNFGGLPALNSTGAYVVGITSWNGIPIWESKVITDSKFNNGLAQDIGELSTDHGYIVLIGGSTITGTHAYLQKATEEGLEFSTRHANPSNAENNTEASDTLTSTVFPNPFNNMTTLRLQTSIDPSESSVSLSIIDMTGRIVNRIDGITTRETTISAENLVNGIYFYQVIQKGNILGTGKMMINK